MLSDTDVQKYATIFVYWILCLDFWSGQTKYSNVFTKEQILNDPVAVCLLFARKVELLFVTQKLFQLFAYSLNVVVQQHFYKGLHF